MSGPMDWQKVIRAIGGANVPPDVASSTGGAALTSSAGDLQWRRGRGYVLGMDWGILQKNGQPHEQGLSVSGGFRDNADDDPGSGTASEGNDSEADEAYLEVYGFVRGAGMTCR